MKKNILVVTAACFSLFCLTGFAQAKPVKPSSSKTAVNIKPQVAAHAINGIAAVVNDSLITNEDLNNQVNLIRVKLKKSHTAIPSLSELREQVLQQMIGRELQLQQVKNLKIKVSKKQLDTSINKIAVQNKMTTAQLYASAAKAGFSKAGFEKEISNEILMQMVQSKEVASRISISKQEVDDYLHVLSSDHKQADTYHLGDILVSLPASPSPAQVQAAKAKAAKMIKELKAGADFKKLAFSSSNGLHALQGGDLGWRKMAELPTPFVSYVEKMKNGQVDGPIRTPNGFHVIKLLGVKSSGLKGTPEEKRKQVEQMIFERQFNQALINWVAQLRAQSYIKIEGAQ